MKPAIEKIPFEREKEGKNQKFIIKKKDYGTVVFFDIFFNDLFLFSLALDGTILVANWEAAKKEPLALKEESLMEMLDFALEKSVSDKGSHLPID
ncbi:MAG TPA: hypothetical protein VK084_10345 [Chitinophagaceae bacterium]|nr:hypothetical protein [Chitinophagaceae bacterium]